MAGKGWHTQAYISAQWVDRVVLKHVLTRSGYFLIMVLLVAEDSTAFLWGWNSLPVLVLKLCSCLDFYTWHVMGNGRLNS